jgi:hypothetical protein
MIFRRQYSYYVVHKLITKGLIYYRLRDHLIEISLPLDINYVIDQNGIDTF